MKIAFRATAAFALILPLCAMAAAAHADVPTCDGKAATMIVSEPPTTTTPQGEPLATGTDGDDVIVVTTSAWLEVDGGPGDDTVCGGGQTTILGGDGNDDLWDGAHHYLGYQVSGGPGNDVLHGGFGRSELFGDAGDDTLYGGLSGSRLEGGDGDDNLIGGPSADLLDGGSGSNIAYGGAGDDWFDDESGDDLLTGGAGSDTLLLGTTDAVGACGPVSCECPQLGATPTIWASLGYVDGLGDDSFQGFEHYDTGLYDAAFYGTRGPDHVTTGDCGTTYIQSFGGDDRIEVHDAGGGTVDAGKGDDHILVDSDQTVTAGPGDDVVSLDPNYDFHASSWLGSSLDGGSGRDELVAPYVADVDLRHGVVPEGDSPAISATLSGFEDATVRHPTSRDSQVVGTSGPNVLRVIDPTIEQHTTLIRGLGGDDHLVGGALDIVRGGAGHDWCRGYELSGCEVRHVVS